MSRLGLGKKKPILEPEEQKVAQKSWFSKLSTRAVANMHHLLKTSSDVRQGKGGMKWDDFVKVCIDFSKSLLGGEKIHSLLSSEAYGGDGFSM